MSAPKPEYLGDGVYASCMSDQNFPLVLTLGHHDLYRATAAIYFEPEYLAALKNYIARIEAHHADLQKIPAPPPS